MAETLPSLRFTHVNQGTGLTQVLVYLDDTRVGDMLLNDRQLVRFERIFDGFHIGGRDQ